MYLGNKKQVLTCFSSQWLNLSQGETFLFTSAKATLVPVGPLRSVPPKSEALIPAAQDCCSLPGNGLPDPGPTFSSPLALPQTYLPLVQNISHLPPPHASAHTNAILLHQSWNQCVRPVHSLALFSGAIMLYGQHKDLHQPKC